MGNRRRRGGAKHRKPHPQTPPLQTVRPAASIPTIPLGSDGDKLAAIALDKAAHAREGKRSFVLANKTRLSLVAVCHCGSAEDLEDLKAAIEGLQRTYHPRDEEPIGEAAPPMDRPEPAGVRYRGREPIEATNGQVFRVGDRMKVTVPARPGRPVYRGTPAPDADLDGIQAFEAASAEEE